MKKNKLNLNVLKLSLSDLLKLHQLSLLAFLVAKHDLRNSMSSINASVYIASKLLKKKSDTTDFWSIDKTGYDRLSEEFKSIQQKVTTFYTSFENIMDISHDQKGDSFVSKPFNIFRTISTINKNVNISIEKKSLKSLEILFPENVLFGIFSELVNNAKKHNKGKCQIKIKWKIEAKKFVLEVHDNGKGITNGTNYVPIDQLGICTTGLSIINRIISLCEGHLFFSKSQYLNGTKVYIDFPVRAYFKKGTLYDFTKH